MHLQNQTSEVLVGFVAGCAHGVDDDMKPLAGEIAQQGSECPGHGDKKAEVSAARVVVFVVSCIKTLSTQNVSSSTVN